MPKIVALAGDVDWSCRERASKFALLECSGDSRCKTSQQEGWYKKWFCTEQKVRDFLRYYDPKTNRLYSKKTKGRTLCVTDRFVTEIARAKLLLESPPVVKGLGADCPAFPMKNGRIATPQAWIIPEGAKEVNVRVATTDNKLFVDCEDPSTPHVFLDDYVKGSPKLCKLEKSRPSPGKTETKVYIKHFPARGLYDKGGCYVYPDAKVLYKDALDSIKKHGTASPYFYSTFINEKTTMEGLDPSLVSYVSGADEKLAAADKGYAILLFLGPRVGKNNASRNEALITYAKTAKQKSDLAKTAKTTAGFAAGVREWIEYTSLRNPGQASLTNDSKGMGWGDIARLPQADDLLAEGRIREAAKKAADQLAKDLEAISASQAKLLLDAGFSVSETKNVLQQINPDMPPGDNFPDQGLFSGDWLFYGAVAAAVFIGYKLVK